MRVLVPVPDKDFDVTEVAVPWRILRSWAGRSALSVTPAFVVRDGRYVSARWPGDAYLFARSFRDLLTQPG